MVAPVTLPLTPAELRLLPHLASHLSLQGIADELVIGRETAKTQAASIYRKLGVCSRAGAVAEARRIGLITGVIGLAAEHRWSSPEPGDAPAGGRS